MIGCAPFPPSDPSSPSTGMPNLILDCASVEELAPAFALGALEDSEGMQVTRHCAVCPRCALLLAQAKSAVSFLPFMVDPVEAPPSAKHALFARIDAENVSSPPAAASASIWTPSLAASTPTLPSSRAIPPTHPVGDPPSRRSGRRLPSSWSMLIAPLAAVPLVLALAIVGGWAMQAQARLQDQKTVLTKMRHENAALSAQVGAPVANAAPLTYNARSFTMAPPKGSTPSKAGGTLSSASGSSNAQLLVWNLPTTSTSTDFQVEVEATDGARFSAGTVTIGLDGRGSATLNFPTPIDACRFVHIRPMNGDDIGGAANAASPLDVLVAEINGTLGGNPGTDAYSNAH